MPTTTLPPGLRFLHRSTGRRKLRVNNGVRSTLSCGLWHRTDSRPTAGVNRSVSGQCAMWICSTKEVIVMRCEICCKSAANHALCHSTSEPTDSFQEICGPFYDNSPSLCSKTVFMFLLRCLCKLEACQGLPQLHGRIEPCALAKTTEKSSFHGINSNNPWCPVRTCTLELIDLLESSDTS